MSIPKKIHYCWFGKGELPTLAIKCINSWKKFCPDYEIILWDENSFDINSNTYVKEAYESKKYAFVTDYVRLYALYNFGGIYMDTDVEVIKNLDDFLQYDGFSGFETETTVPTGIMASVKGTQLLYQLLEYYDNRHFVIDGEFDTTTNVEIITKIFIEKGLKANNSFQCIEGFSLFPKDFFCPKNYQDGQIYLTSNTVTIHHFSGSWQSRELKKATYLIRKYGKKIGSLLYVGWLAIYSHDELLNMLKRKVKK